MQILHNPGIIADLRSGIQGASSVIQGNNDATLSLYTASLADASEGDATASATEFGALNNQKMGSLEEMKTLCDHAMNQGVDDCLTVDQSYAARIGM